MSAKKKPTRRVMDMAIHPSPALLSPGRPLREAFAVHWHGYLHDSDLARRTRGVVSAWARLLEESRRAHRHPGPCKAHDPDRKDLRAARRDIKVRIVLTYPLFEPRARVVSLDLARVGEVFGLAADFYRDLYAEDARRGGGKHVYDLPFTQSALVNRAAGPLVWGHDLEDLVFEGIKWTPYKRKDRDGAVGEFTFVMGS